MRRPLHAMATLSVLAALMTTTRFGGVTEGFFVGGGPWLRRKRTPRQQLGPVTCPTRTTSSLSLAAMEDEDDGLVFEYKYIDDPDDLRDVCESLSKESSLSFDLEAEFNRHRYGMHLCLLQIATDPNINDDQTIYLIDPVPLNEHLGMLWDILENPDIQLVVHGADSDLLLLDYLFGVHPTNLFDTDKAAALLLQEERIRNVSLKSLLKKYFDIDKNADLAKSNWGIRPIDEIMCQYAALDVAFGHELRNLLALELEQQGLTKDHELLCKQLEELRYVEKPASERIKKIKGYRYLSAKERRTLEEIYKVREAIAESMDKPPFYLINNRRLMELCRDPPRDWSQVKGVHPKVRKKGRAFRRAVAIARSQP